MSEVKVKIDLDLDTEKAEGQLKEFQNSSKDKKVPISLDIENITTEAKQLKKILLDAFDLDNKAFSNLKQVEESLKQINSLIKNQQDLSSTIGKNTLQNGNIDKSVKEYLSVSKEIDNVLAKLYKSENRKQGETTDSLNKELSLLEKKRSELAKLVDTTSDYVKQERELATAKALTSMSREDDLSSVNNLKKEEQQLKELISTYDKYEKELTQLKTAQNEFRYNSQDGQANALDSQIKSLEELKKKLREVNNEQFGDKLYPELEKIEKKYKDVARAAEEVSRGKYDDSNTSKLNKTYQELDKIQDKLTSMQNTKGFLDNSMVEKTNSLLSETRKKLDANGIESDFREISAAIDSMSNNLKTLNAGNTLNRQEASFNVSLQNMENKVDSFINKCKELGNADHLINRVEQAFRSINTDNIERANVDLRQMATTLNQAEREARQLASSMNNTRTFFGNFGQEFRDNLFMFTAGELLADGIRNVAYSLKTIVMEYDKSMTNLKKVADPKDIMDISQLDAIEKKAVGIAKNVGQSSQDTIQAIADTIQMSGLGMEASIMVAEQTMKLANVAEMTQEAASKGVVTMLSAFNLDPMREVPLVVNGVTQSVNEMTNAMDIVNHVGNNFAVSSDGIIDAITSGANVLSSYGVSLEDTVAMITGANTTLQDTSRVKFLTSYMETYK